MAENRFVITISYQLGCGGAALGQKLSERLGIPFFDREILKRVAEQFHLAEGALEGREERLSSFWRSLNRIAVMTNPIESMSLENYEPDDREIFQLESDCIRQIAQETSAIFLGRCGRYILRDHPRLFSILVHADMPDRVRRVQELFGLDAGEAKKLIDQNDREREAYIRTFTHQNLLDARLYDLCLNTSSLGMEKSAELALLAISQKLEKGST